MSNPIALRLHEMGLQLEGAGLDEIVVALGVAEREIERLHEALLPFRHMRVIVDEREIDTHDIRNLDEQGREITIGYARSSIEGDQFNQVFEKVRTALREPTRGNQPCPSCKGSGFVTYGSSTGPRQLTCMRCHGSKTVVR
jgi:hypothetical protein